MEKNGSIPSQYFLPQEVKMKESLVQSHPMSCMAEARDLNPDWFVHYLTLVPLYIYFYILKYLFLSFIFVFIIYLNIYKSIKINIYIYY